jgi:hypothetical protein
LESLYITPGGFAMGVASSTLFICVQASIDPAHSAVAASTLYLAASIGSVLGMASSSAVLQGSLRLILDRKLGEGGFHGGSKQKVGIHTREWQELLADQEFRSLNGRCLMSITQNTRSLQSQISSSLHTWMLSPGVMVSRVLQLTCIIPNVDLSAFFGVFCTGISDYSILDTAQAVKWWKHIGLVGNKWWREKV